MKLEQIQINTVTMVVGECVYPERVSSLRTMVPDTPFHSFALFLEYLGYSMVDWLL